MNHDRPALRLARRTPLADALRLFRGEFYGSRGTKLKGAAFRRERSDASIPADHREVVRFVADFLRPIFNDLVCVVDAMPGEEVMTSVPQSYSIHAKCQPSSRP
jgi:hypothetical protein